MNTHKISMIEDVGRKRWDGNMYALVIWAALFTIKKQFEVTCYYDFKKNFPVMLALWGADMIISFGLMAICP
jgi:hypothetical protein